MSENPRQFSSIDSSDTNLHGSLTNRSPSGAPAGDPIDFEALNRQVINQRTQQDYVYKESTAEYVLRREREIAAAQRIRQETADAQAARELQDQRNQNQRNELANRINNNTPTDSEVAPPKESPLAQQQRSTPERLPVPSTGAPPPTPNGTAARANSLVEPTATPTPAALKEAIAPAAAGGALAALPRSLPQAAGHLAIPGIYATVDFTNRVVHGQSVQQAATSSVAGAVGSGIGFVLGTATDIPFMGYVGAAVGGIAGSAISDYFFNQNLPTTAAKQETQSPNYVPFVGGQSSGTSYRIWYDIPGDDGTVSHQVTAPLQGKIVNFYFVANSQNSWDSVLIYNNGNNTEKTSFIGSQTAGKPYIVKITRADNGSTDLVGYPVSSSSPAPPPDNLPYRYNTSPVGNDNTVPSGTPGASANKGKTRNVAPSMPSNNTPNGAPFFPSHGGLAPSYLPNPTLFPSNLGGMLPSLQPLPMLLPSNGGMLPSLQSLPLLFAEPEDIPLPRLAPKTGLTVTPSSGGLVPIGYAEITPATITPAMVAQFPGQTITPAKNLTPLIIVDVNTFVEASLLPAFEETSNPGSAAFSGINRMCLVSIEINNIKKSLAVATFSRVFDYARSLANNDLNPLTTTDTINNSSKTLLNKPESGLKLSIDGSETIVVCSLSLKINNLRLTYMDEYFSSTLTYLTNAIASDLNP
ncbi:MAG: hypothetical protein V7K89_21535 [Nostoc sp.]|uniref:glycine zipper family protein n=1 Tax=Nostoc sp. TaxID=1180 RepID=UPI002FF54F8E